MEKIKWKWDKQYKEWYVNESPAMANNGFLITKRTSGGYRLQVDSMNSVMFFKKLKSAKTVANLLRHG